MNILNILNKTGHKLLALKTEMDKDYPEIIKESMRTTLNVMLSDGDIDSNAFNLTINSSKTTEVFKNYLLSHDEYKKSAEEIREELNKCNKEIRETLLKQSSDLNGVEFSSDEEGFGLTLTKIFTIEEEFIMEYFGATEQDITKLMKKGGFIEAFVSLRLTKILSDMESYFNKHIEKSIKIHYSLPYRSKSGAGFSIELFMDFSAEQYENKKEREIVLSDLAKVLNKCDSIFIRKMEI